MGLGDAATESQDGSVRPLAPYDVPSRYFPQMDGLRTLAVLGVLIAHFWDYRLPTGHLGVRLFFVISGFLITGILLQERLGSEAASRRTLIKAFYIRRALRIFPAYYTMLFLGLVLSVEGVRETLLWHLTYTSNLFYAMQSDWEPWTTVHLWTLSVEEQFYLVWPTVLLFLPRRWLLPALAGAILFAIGFRHAVGIMWPLGNHRDTLMPAMMDALALGGLLSAAPLLLNWGAAERKRLALVLAALSVPALGLILGPWGEAVPYAVGDFLATIPMACAVLAARNGLPGLAGKALDNKVTRYLGKISYGIYLWHLFALAALYKLVPGFGDAPLGPVKFLIGSAAAIGLAALSWHYLEQPLNALKWRFPYSGNRRVEQARFSR